MIDTISSIHKHLLTTRKSWKPSGNYASQAGHPCERNLVYQRVDYDKKMLPEPSKLLIFRDGNIHEDDIIKLLKESGFEIVEQQRPFDWKDIQLTGRIDGKIKDGSKLIPLEIKSASHYSFQKINSQEDIQKSNSFWVRGYLAQMYLYMLMDGSENGIFIFKNKDTGQLKQIDIELDYEEAEKIVKKLERINSHVKSGTYPDRIDDRSVCQYCEFRQVCLPNESSPSLFIENNEEIVAMLEDREKLKESADKFDEIDSNLKDVLKFKTPGEYLYGGKFQVKISSYLMSSYEVPKEIKEQYKKQKPVVKTQITKI